MSADEPEPERSPSPEEKYNSQVDIAGARLEVLPLFDTVVPGFINRVPVLFQFVTGTDPQLRREAFSLAVVMDVSGSMCGNKLTSCKAAVTQLIDCAADEDVLSLVAYDDTVQVIFESIRCGDPGARAEMKNQVSAVEARGGTDLYSGLLAGYRLLQHQVNELNKHIFLLSDGQTNSGPVTNTADILKAVSEWDIKIPIISYGIGGDFNEQLMSPLGQVHRGSHYFYITDAASIEKLIARGVRSLTGAVARNVRLSVKPTSSGVWLPDHMIEGSCFPLVRERSVIQFVVDLEVRPELPAAVTTAHSKFRGGLQVTQAPASTWFCARRRMPMAEAADVYAGLGFAWEVHGFPLLERSSGTRTLALASERGQEAPDVRTFLDVKRGCELRRGAAGSAEARALCEQALQLFEGRVNNDRFGFAQEWADKTRALLEDHRLWRGNAASDSAAKHLGVRHASNVAREEEEEEEMDFDLFG
eukprot:gnl/TRDRNA2_/TRDRNA2_184485_c0_seq1.p1 gnl/TRDRNA2_/TRDRNA2_184485_c0~~gnl/TRDRNA2_/TRDRNA2_184485_c0_seq1.p1  ORF type:complete len:488 (-),score=90.12 gnl/TRDRNA2_/TRDRNA2_184485_c0_seq1:201-1622(-)